MWLYFCALFATLAAEVIVAFLFFRLKKTEATTSDRWLCILGVNLITHPLAYIGFAFFAPAFLLIELIVIVAEAYGIRQLIGLPPKQSVALSVSMNLASVAAAAFFL